ncbi:MAG: ribonuclease III [Candidatus Kapaibacteriales bacterium]
MARDLVGFFSNFLGSSEKEKKTAILSKSHGLLSAENLEALVQLIDYDDFDIGLFEQSLTHRSFIKVRNDLELVSNERLEFLGDAVLDMVVSDYLYNNHEKLPEGSLSNLRSAIVNKYMLAHCGRVLGIDKLLIISYGAEKAMNNGSHSIVADALEAIIAAVYLDKGYRQVEKFIHEKVLPLVKDYKEKVEENYKSTFQEAVQSLDMPPPSYRVLDEIGKAHEREYVIAAFVGDTKLAEGIGNTKKIAEQEAARLSLEIIKEKGL